MDKNRKIGLIGHLMYNYEAEAVNGQAIKTRNFYQILCERYGKENIVTLDTNYFRKNLFANYVQVFSICNKCSTILILPTSNGLKLLLPVLKYLKKKRKFKILYPVIGGWLPEYLKMNKGIKKLLHCVDYIYPETNDMRDAIKRMGFDNVETLYNFSIRKTIKTLPEKQWKSSPFKFCTFSRVTKEKGIEEAIKAISTINKNKKVCTLDIYGPIDSGYKDEFKNILMSTDDAIQYKGVLEGDDVIATLSQYFVMLFPTYYHGEGMPGAVLEAFSAGVPVIATNWHSNAEVITHGETGLIYELGDINNLISMISFVIDHPDDIVRMKYKCLKERNKYTPINIMQPIFKIIER